MNTTTTTNNDISADTHPDAATTKTRKATRGKRRMAREASEPVPAVQGIGADKPQRSQSPARVPSKIASVVTLLKREQGATLAEMVEATGWLPHTTRAALTGLKKKGHTIAKDKRDDVTCYRIVKAA